MDIQNKIIDLKQRIAELPIGYISKKTINGKIRFYHQWTENKKIKSKYIKDGEYDDLKEKIELRKELQKQLKDLEKKLPNGMRKPDLQFDCNVTVGSDLLDMTKNILKYERRDCYADLQDFLNNNVSDKVCVIYGLRRTGKTTMLRQAVSDMTDSEINRTAYIKITKQNNLAEVNRDLKLLKNNGYRNIFIDEVTLMSDFIDSAALFSDVYGAMGMKIVLSGTDSLGFWLASHEELYDRVKMIPTTFIPFREHARLLHIDSIDEYIRYGGTLKVGELRFDSNIINDDEASFRDDESTRIYIDTAISRNIQNSLAYYDGGGHFRHLQELYYAGELTGAINRIIEDMNHEFVVSVLTRDFVSHDLGISARNLRKDNTQPDILDEVNTEKITSQLMEILNIRNKAEQTVNVNETHVKEIQEYLSALDLIYENQVNTIDGEGLQHTIFTQPGMRYCQAQALIHSLMNDKAFSAISECDKVNVTDRILDEVRGRMMEDIVLFETSKAMNNKKVFQLQFAVGEFDMVMYDGKTNTCKIYEIKHSREAVPQQYRHLIDEEKCLACENKYGKIVEKSVIYRGESCEAENGIRYINVEEYLKALESPDMIMSEDIDMQMNM